MTPASTAPCAGWVSPCSHLRALSPVLSLPCSLTFVAGAGMSAWLVGVCVCVCRACCVRVCVDVRQKSVVRPPPTHNSEVPPLCAFFPFNSSLPHAPLRARPSMRATLLRATPAGPGAVSCRPSTSSRAARRGSVQVFGEFGRDGGWRKKKKKGLTEEGRPWQPSRCGRSLAGVVFARPGAYVLRPLARPVLTRPPQPRSSASLSEGVAEVAGRQGRGGNGGGAPGRAEVRRRRQRGGPCPHPQQKREPEPPRSASIHTRAVCTPASPPGHGAQY